MILKSVVVKESLFPSLIVLLRTINSFLIIFVVSEAKNQVYDLFSVDYSYIGIFLVFGNFFTQKSVRSKGEKTNVFWFFLMVLISAIFQVINGTVIYFLPIFLNLLNSLLLSLDYKTRNMRYQKKSLVLLVFQTLFLVFSFNFWLNYKFFICIYLSLPVVLTFRRYSLRQLTFSIKELKGDVHMVVWVLAQSFCFPVAFYFLRLYLLESDYKLIEFDLIQKVLLVPSLLFGTILSSRLYVLDLSEEIFSLKYKPFRFFFVLTIIYFGLFLVIVVVGKMNDLNLFTSFSLLIILLYSLLELIKFAYGHISNYFYFFGSSYILLLFEIVLALTWFFSAKANLDLHYLLFVVMGAYFSTSVILYRMQGRLRIKL